MEHGKRATLFFSATIRSDPISIARPRECECLCRLSRCTGVVLEVRTHASPLPGHPSVSLHRDHLAMFPGTGAGWSNEASISAKAYLG